MIAGFVRRLGGGGAAGRDRVWRRGEAIACRTLKRAGHRVLARNLRTPIGEIDVLTCAPDGRTVVVVEVKARAGGASHRPEESITATKRRKLVQLTRWIGAQHVYRGRPVRIDVVAVEFDDRGRRALDVRHHERAVTASPARRAGAR